MKIKEVIEQTGLTDKAIRLYINNSLVAPSIEESYSGRKSINFSDSDVERLKNIALLRKADFSIADIKDMISDEDSVRKVIDSFIEEKEKSIRIDTEIINAIKKLNGERLSFETLCEVLAGTTTEKEVPPGDVQYSKREKIIKSVFKIFGIINLIVFIGFIIFAFVLIKIEHRFIHFEENWLFALLLAYGGLVIGVVLSILLIRLSNVKVIIKNHLGKISAVSISLILVLMISIPWSVIYSATVVAGVITSKTEKEENYLQLDDFVERQKSDVFPNAIPVQAERVKYYYRYYSAFLEYKFDIFAEWTLPRNVFKDVVKSKLYYFEKVPVTINKEYNDITYELQLKEREVASKGDWNLIYYEDSDAGREWESDEGGYHIVIFAYNEKTKTVRYIDSESDYGGYEPYYVSLEW